MGDAIEVIQVANEDAEAKLIANQIIEQKLLRASRFKQFSVLVRSNRQSKLLELKFQAKQIPYHITGGTSFFLEEGSKILFATCEFWLILMMMPKRIKPKARIP